MSISFGNTTFGAPSATSAPAFGFGASTTTAKPATGFGTSSFSFGSASTATTAPNFGLGSNTAATTTPGFGGFSGFGTTATSTQAPTFGGFGSTTTSQATTFSGFGAPTTTTSGFSFGGFGTTTTATSTTPSLFSGFGQPQTQTGGAFGKPFGATATPSAGLGSFGLGSGLGTGFGQQQPQQTQTAANAQQSENEQVLNSVLNCCMFGDEKDQVLAQWNLLQACWGTGKGYYNTQLPPVEYTPRNPYYKFKAIAYSKKPAVEARDGFVSLQFNKKFDELRPQQEQMRAALNNLINKPNLALHVDSIQAMSESVSKVNVYVEEKVQSGQTKRIPSPDLANYLINSHKQQLMNMGVSDVYPFVAFDKDYIQEYLNNPPAGIGANMWRQAQCDNPDVEKYIPVPLLGFSDIRWRYNCQVEETRKHQAFLDQIADAVTKLKSQNEESLLKILEYKHKVVDLEHRILKLMVKQQITQNIGISLQPEEEILRSQLDSIQARLNSPQLSGKLSEMLTQIRLHKQEASQQNSDAYNMSLSMQQTIKQFLATQEFGIKSLMDTMQGDVEDIKKMRAEMISTSKQKS
ncbi:nucleoporin [Nesidiocoris tenuis]|uniref:Nucleoporin n=1 Tax=Nesidiocoris tenuis TaxID=355587 RepID=A0ABN7APZ3_9HEMI|nr:nucleoporin [Nesidiocoris tenuis]